MKGLCPLCGVRDKAPKNYISISEQILKNSEQILHTPSNDINNQNSSNINKNSENIKNYTNDKSLNSITNNNSNSTNSTQPYNPIYKQNSLSNPASYLNDTTTRKDNIESVKREFGQLADLLGSNLKQDESQIFKLDLFKKTYKNSHNIYEEGDDERDDFIEIEREKGDNINKIKGMFDDIELPKEEEEIDDLLDLMDMAANK